MLQKWEESVKEENLKYRKQWNILTILGERDLYNKACKNPTWKNQ